MTTYYWAVVTVCALAAGACLGWMIRDMQRVDRLAPLTSDMSGAEIATEAQRVMRGGK